MKDGQAIIQVRLETTEPIELRDFIGAFASIGSEYARFIKRDHPDLSDDARMYVSQVRQGSIIADLIPMVMPILQAADYTLIVDQFVKRVGDIIQSYQTPNAQPTGMGKSAIKDAMQGLAAIANDPNGRANISSVYVEGSVSKVRAAITFDTDQARTALGNMREHVRMIEHHEDLNKKMVLMKFFQSNLRDAELQTRSGMQVIIQSVDARPKPLVYASELAKERIAHEIAGDDRNIYKKGFYVDVVVDMAGDRVAAYKVTNFHSIIDLPD